MKKNHAAPVRAKKTAAPDAPPDSTKRPTTKPKPSRHTSARNCIVEMCDVLKKHEKSRDWRVAALQMFMDAFAVQAEANDDHKLFAKLDAEYGVENAATVFVARTAFCVALHVLDNKPPADKKHARNVVARGAEAMRDLIDGVAAEMAASSLAEAMSATTVRETINPHNLTGATDHELLMASLAFLDAPHVTPLAVALDVAAEDLETLSTLDRTTSTNPLDVANLIYRTTSRIRIVAELIRREHAAKQ